MSPLLRSVWGRMTLVLWPVRRHGWQHWLGWAFNRSIYALWGMAAGLGLAWVALDDPVEEHLQVSRLVDPLRAQLQGQGQPASQSTSQSQRDVLNQIPAEAASGITSYEAFALMEHLPGQRTVARVWTDLQQVLSQHGLRVASLRPVPESLTAPLPSQRVAVRMTGRFADWQSAWATLSEAGPVWSIERISVVPQPAMAGVQIDAVLRVWLRPDLDGPTAWPAGITLPARTDSVGPEIFAQSLSGSGVDVSPVTPASSMGTFAEQSTAALSSDPLQWPLARMRLAGIWQHGSALQAVLVAGPHAVRMHAGQRVAQEGLRLEAVTHDSVHLRSPQGALHVLNLEGGSR